MRGNFFETKNILQIVFFASLIFIPLIGVAPNLHSDAGGYIYFSCWRPPVYPIFIWLFKFAGPYQMYWVIWVQSLVLFLSLIFAKYWLEDRLKLRSFITFLIITGTIIVDFFSSKILHHVYTEALAFSFFIFT